MKRGIMKETSVRGSKKERIWWKEKANKRKTMKRGWGSSPEKHARSRTEKGRGRKKRTRKERVLQKAKGKNEERIWRQSKRTRRPWNSEEIIRRRRKTKEINYQAKRRNIHFSAQRRPTQGKTMVRRNRIFRTAKPKNIWWLR